MFIHSTPSDTEHVFTEAAPDWGFGTAMLNTELHKSRDGWISDAGELVIQVRGEGEGGQQL